MWRELRTAASLLGAAVLAFGLTVAAPTAPALAASVADQTAAASLDPGGPDVIGVADDGLLWLFSGDGNGAFATSRPIGASWQTLDQIRMVGDLDGKGNSDVLARSTRDGSLWLYPGRGDGSVAAGVKIGTGWSAFSTIFSPGDFNGDAVPDVLAVLTRDGSLWMYPGRGNGTVAAGRLIGSGWGAFTSLVPTGDFDGNGRIDFLARARTGDLYLYRGNGTGGFSGSVRVGRGWGAFTGLSGPGDFDGDGRSDVLARTSAGDLYLYRGNGATGFAGSSLVSRGWNGVTFVEDGAAATAPRLPATATANQLLAELITAPEHNAGFNQALPEPPWDNDGDCVDAYNEVLARESLVTPTMTSDGCQVATGRWRSPWNGEILRALGDVAVGPLVTMEEAWASGAYRWPDQVNGVPYHLLAMANDDSYRYTLVAGNLFYGEVGQDPAQWLPPLESAWCTYAVRWIAVKYRWDLAVDPAERTALEGLLAAGSCGSVPIAVPARA